MKRIDKIMAHPLFVSNQKRIEELEQERVYCRHGLNHSLSVARILYIKVLEENIPIKKDVIYAAALLHDIGRGVEYEQGGAHHEAGAEIAALVLADCGYTKSECQQITTAIMQHKEMQTRTDNVLCKLLYEADKLSRCCFCCQVKDKCYWPDEKKNHTICY